MGLKQAAKIAASCLVHPVYTAHALAVHRRSSTPDLQAAIRRGADWLLRAQECAPDGDGYSRRYTLYLGWDRCYIETTGYIIPTLLDVSRIFDAPQYRSSAERAAEWLLKVQTEGGAFSDIDTHRPQAFDTGQVMLGLARMFRETSDGRFLDAAGRAASWLVSTQEPDGAWVQNAYHRRPHTYYSRVAAALIEVGLLSHSDVCVEAGRRNLKWVLSQQQPNGYFAFSEFKEGEDAYLHTIVYVLEGLLMAYCHTQETAWRDALIVGARALLQRVNSYGMLYSQYDANWQATNKEYCVTGLAQYAGLCMDLFEITGDRDFANAGSLIVDRLCSLQQLRGVDLIGALQSSVPLWGRYGGMDFFNWNTKFFIDAAIKFLVHRRSAARPTSSRES